MTRKRKPPVEHYLISLMIGDQAGYAHSYVLTDEFKLVEHAAGEMIDQMEKMGFPLMVPMIMSTKLDKGTTTKVRKFVNEICPESIETMKTATTYHRTMWVAGVDNTPQWLMDIH